MTTLKNQIATKTEKKSNYDIKKTSKIKRGVNKTVQKMELALGGCVTDWGTLSIVTCTILSLRIRFSPIFFCCQEMVGLGPENPAFLPSNSGFMGVADNVYIYIYGFQVYIHFNL